MLVDVAYFVHVYTSEVLTFVTSDSSIELFKGKYILIIMVPNAT